MQDAPIDDDVKRFTFYLTPTCISEFYLKIHLKPVFDAQIHLWYAKSTLEIVFRSQEVGTTDVEPLKPAPSKRNC